jgi:hypothetical protein
MISAQKTPQITLSEHLEPGYREALDEAVNHHIGLFDTRSYDLVGRRIGFPEYDWPVDVLVVELDRPKVRAEYIHDETTESFRREIAVEKFLDQFGVEWDKLSAESSDRFNANVDDASLAGDIYFQGNEDAVDEFLREYTGEGLSHYEEIQVAEP